MPANSPPPPRGGYAVYARLSRKQTGRAGRAKRRRNELETVERQEAIIRRWAAEQGIPINDDHVYVDNHLSAWRPADRGGERPAWEAMLAAAEAGKFPGILVYRLDRFARNTPDAYALARLGDAYDLIVDGPNSGRISLRTATGRKNFRDGASAAEYESDNTSERTRDGLADRLSRGLQLGGGRLYGFEVLAAVREYEDDVEPVQRPAEVAVIREVARRAIDGERWADLAADLNRRGLLTVRGNRWSGSQLRAVVSAPRYGGYVMHLGEVIGRNTGEPVLDEDTYGQLQGIVGTARRGRRPSGQFRLTGTLLCANPVHGDQPHPMAGHRHTSGQNKRVKSYICARSSGGCGATVNAAPVEAMVRARVLEAANDPDTAARLAAEARAITDAHMNAAAKVKRLEGLLIELETERAEETIRPHAYQAAKAVYDRRIAEAEAEQRQLGYGPPGEDAPPMTGMDYDDMTPGETQAAITRLRLRVRLLPWRAGAPRNRFDPERVVIEEVDR